MSFANVEICVGRCQHMWSITLCRRLNFCRDKPGGKFKPGDGQWWEKNYSLHRERRGMGRNHGFGVNVATVGALLEPNKMSRKDCCRS